MPCSRVLAGLNQGDVLEFAEGVVDEPFDSSALTFMLGKPVTTRTTRRSSCFADAARP